MELGGWMVYAEHQGRSRSHSEVMAIFPGRGFCSKTCIAWAGTPSRERRGSMTVGGRKLRETSWSGFRSRPSNYFEAATLENT